MLAAVPQCAVVWGSKEQPCRLLHLNKGRSTGSVPGRFLPTPSIHHLKRKSEEHKDFPFTLYQRLGILKSVTSLSKVFLCLSHAFFPLPFFSLPIFPLSFPLSYYQAGLLCLSLIQCSSSTPTWGTRWFLITHHSRFWILKEPQLRYLK